MQDNLKILLLLSSLEGTLEQLRIHLDMAIKRMGQIKDEIESHAAVTHPREPIVINPDQPF